MSLKIGIPAQEQPDNKFGVNINYLQFIYGFGRPVVILPENYDDFKEIYKLDAVVLPGGADVDSRRYSKAPMYGNYNPNIYLEHFDANILPALLGNIPIFGICRGLQTLNVVYGGSLKNLWFHPYSNYDMDEAHKVMAAGEKKEMGVNSFHHQGISKLADNFSKEAVSNDKFEAVIEAISDFRKRIFAVQWHPERLLDVYSINKFKEILK